MNKLFKLLSVLFLVSIYAGTALGHGEKVDYFIPRNLPKILPPTTAAVTDVWSITCTKGPEKPDDPIVTPTRLAFHVQDLSPPLSAATVSVKASKLGFPSTPSYTDATDGNSQYDTGSNTVFHYLNGGVGVYTLSVTKSATTTPSKERYRVQFHCWNNAQGHSTIKCTKTGEGEGKQLC
ncbi:MAG: hypothetical protein HOO87_10685 [Methyloglobulus sp.]|nr:hypothetical protein [Methyloglobulus sp.]